MKYFQLYQSIDIALDPFPFGGGTTTCNALWMGVPVVSLAGKTAVGRGGLSILSNVGLPELVAKNPEEYVRIAVDLATPVTAGSRLAELRSTLRGACANRRCSMPRVLPAIWKRRIAPCGGGGVRAKLTKRTRGKRIQAWYCAGWPERFWVMADFIFIGLRC